VTGNESVDLLAVGAHPDDVELGAGGTLLRAVHAGVRVGVLDLTRGELSSRGTVSERRAEAERAASLLGLVTRQNVDLPDGGLANTDEQRRAVIPFIRALKPKVLLTHAPVDRHPDHVAAHGLVRDANFFAGVTSIETDAQPHRAKQLYYFHPYQDNAQEPRFVMDISEFFERKVEVLRAHTSQFYNEEYAGDQTHVSSARFWEAIRTRAAYWGNTIGVEYGEPFHSDGPLALGSLPGLGVSE
jgi:bacillithiol biosynthesis deacetylase BshB1